MPANASVFDNPRNKDSVFSARNYGASLARAQTLLFLDDDVLVTQESIDYAVEFHKAHPTACCNVNWVYPPELVARAKRTLFGRFLICNGFAAMKSLYGSDGSWRDDAPFQSNGIASFFFSITKSDFERIGGYNEEHLHEGTDDDLRRSLAEKGVAMYINPLVTVHHNEEDRIEIGGWLDRKRRLGAIRANAARMGDRSHGLSYSRSKKTIFSIIYALQPLFVSLLDHFPGNGALDSVGFVVIKGLLGANICAGYNAALPS